MTNMLNRMAVLNPDGSLDVPSDATREFYERGVAIPAIDRIMFNSGSKKIYKLDPKTHEPIIDKKTGKKILLKTIPTLTTVLYFIDGTKTVVTNSANDSLQLDANNKPTRLAKELGIIYAYTKRCMVGAYAYDDNCNLEITHEGFGRVLNELIDNAYDCQEAATSLKASKLAAAKKQEEIHAAAVARKANKNPSLAESVRELKDCVDLLKNQLTNKSAPTKPTKKPAKKPTKKMAKKTTAKNSK